MYIPGRKLGPDAASPGELVPLPPPHFKPWRLRHAKESDQRRGQRQSWVGAWASRDCTDQILDRDLIQVAEAQIQLVAVQLVAEVPALATGLGHGDAG